MGLLGAGLQALYQKHYRCINVVLGFFKKEQLS